MKKLSVLGLGMCMVLALASCKSKESMYKKAYEKAQAQEQQTAPVTQEPVVTPLQTTTPSESTNTAVDNATVRQENVSLIAGSGLQNFSVVVGSFGLKANAEGLQHLEERWLRRTDRIQWRAQHVSCGSSHIR